MAQGMRLSSHNAKSIFMHVPVVDANLVPDLRFTAGRESAVFKKKTETISK